MPAPLRLLSLEDSESDLQLILLELQEAGFEPQWERVQTERDYRARLNPDLDIILADYSLPQFDAMNALRLRNELGLDVPFIIVSGAIGEDMAIVAMQQGAADYVLKDRLGRLGQAVSRALEQKRMTDAQKRAEQALQESEARLRIVTDNARVGLVMVNQERRYIFANATYSEVLGLPASDIVGRRVPDVLPEIYEQQIRPRLDRAFAGKRVAYELQKPAQGGDRFYAVTYEPTKVGDLVSHVVVVIVDITERKWMEDAMAAERNLLRTLIDALPDIVFTKDTMGRFVICNPAAFRLVGLAGEAEMAGKTVFDLFPRELADSYHADDLQVLGDRPVLNREEPCIDAEGNKRWHLTIKMPLWDKTGANIGLVGMSHNITERKRAEQALRERSQLALLSADVGMALTQASLLRDMLHECAAAMVRHLGAAFARIWTLNAHDNVLELQASAGQYTNLDGSHSRIPVGKFKIGLIAQEKLPHLTNDVLHDSRVGDPEWARRENMVAFAGYPLLLEDRLVGVMAMFARHALSDSTLDAMRAVANQIATGIQRKQTEAERDGLLARLRMQIDRMPLGYLLTDADFRIIDWNASAERIFGYRKEEVLGMGPPFEKILPPALVPFAEGILGRLRSGDMAAHAIHENRTKDGRSIICQWSNTPLLNADGTFTGLFSLAQDITKRKRAEESLRESQQRSAQLSRQLITAQEAERRHLARELHDEIGQVLSAVKMNLHGLASKLSTPSKLHDSVQIVERAIQQVRTMSLNLRPAMLDDFGLESALRWYLDQQAERAGFTARLSVNFLGQRLSQDLETVFFRVVQEAVTNILRHAQARRVEVTVSNQDAQVTLSIQDDGIGFVVAAARSRASRGGSMGLLGMEERVLLAGGKIAVESAPGRGTKIEVSFPLDPQTKAAGAEESQ